jgi:hypothetical protein
VKYTVLTSRSVLDISYESAWQFQRDIYDLSNEQDELVDKLCPSEYYKATFLESYFCNEHIRKGTLSHMIQCLAAKDGVDLVRFENGKLGYIGYYNGHEHGFELDAISKEECYK